MRCHRMRVSRSHSAIKWISECMAFKYTHNILLFDSVVFLFCSFIARKSLCFNRNEAVDEDVCDEKQNPKLVHRRQRRRRL